MACYDFESDATDSYSSNDGELKGTPSFISGKIGNAIDLNDNSMDEYINVSWMNSTYGYEVVAWINIRSYGGNSQGRIFDSTGLS